MGKLFQDIKKEGKAKAFSDKSAETRNENKALRVEWLLRQFEKYQEYHQRDIERFVRNARMYWHLDFGMWPEAVVEKLRGEGRRPPTFPVIPDKIETLIGSYISNGYDVKFAADDGKIDQLALNVHEMYLSDKNKLDWECAHIIALLDSMIGVGYERFYMTDHVDDFGNLAMESINPRWTLLSPAWKSNYAKDINDYFTWSMKSATEIVEENPNHSERLMELYQRERLNGIDYGIQVGGAPRYRDADEKWMAGHKVYEFHHVQRTERMYEYDKKNLNFFPDTGFEMDSEGDRMIKKEYIRIMGLDPTTDICMLKQKKCVKYIESICPTIDIELKLKDGKDKIQTNSCNIFPVGIRYWGQFMGLVVDRLYDVQQGINKGEMNMQDIQARSAKGAFAMDRGLFGGDSAIEDEVRNNWNDPAARLVLDEGATARYPNGIIKLPGAQPTPEEFRNTDRYYDHADRFSKVSSAQDSRTEGKQESGKLFNMKFEAGKLQQIYPKKFYERHIKEIAIGWLYAAKYSYAGIKRTFATSDGKGTFDVNVPGMNTLTNKPIIINDIATLPRMKITLQPSENGTNQRLERRSQMSEIMQLVEKDPADRPYKILFMNEVLKTMEFGDDFKAQVDIVGNELMKNAMLQTLSVSQQLESQLAMASNQNQQVQEKLGDGGQGALPAPEGEESAPPNASPRQPDEAEMAEGTVMEDQV